MPLLALALVGLVGLVGCGAGATSQGSAAESGGVITVSMPSPKVCPEGRTWDGSVCAPDAPDLGGGRDIAKTPPLEDAREIVQTLSALPEAGSGDWDEAVEKRIVGAYDQNHSGAIDTRAELQRIPCSVWTTLERRLQEDRDIELSSLYGFASDYSWVGDALGFDEPLREEIYRTMQGCGLP